MLFNSLWNGVIYNSGQQSGDDHDDSFQKNNLPEMLHEDSTANRKYRFEYNPFFYALGTYIRSMQSVDFSLYQNIQKINWSRPDRLGWLDK